MISYMDMLLNAFSDETIAVFKDVNNQICVELKYCDVKDGIVLKGDCGRGNCVEEAARDYLKKISGKTLVFHAESTNRKECKIIVIS